MIRLLLSRVLWEVSVSLIFLSLGVFSLRFLSKTGFVPIAELVSWWCLFGHVHRFYTSVQESVGSKIAFSDWPIEVGQVTFVVLFYGHANIPFSD